MAQLLFYRQSAAAVFWNFFNKQTHVYSHTQYVDKVILAQKSLGDLETTATAAVSVVIFICMGTRICPTEISISRSAKICGQPTKKHKVRNVTTKSSIEITPNPNSITHTSQKRILVSTMLVNSPNLTELQNIRRSSKPNLSLFRLSCEAYILVILILVELGDVNIWNIEVG